MVKTIKVGNTDVLFKTSGALPLLYRDMTGHDFFADIQNLGGATNESFDMAYVMHCHACPDEHISKMEWLEQFEWMDITNALGEVINMLIQSQKITSESKKKSAS